MDSARSRAAAIRLAASSTAPRSHNDQDISAISATPASWPAARAASRSLSLLSLNAFNASLITELASVNCPMNSRIMACPRVALSKAGLVAARQRAVENGGDGFACERQFSPHHTGCRQPEHHLQIFRRIAEPFAQFARTDEGFDRRRGSRPLRRDQARAEDKAQIDLLPVFRRTVRDLARDAARPRSRCAIASRLADLAAAFLPAIEPIIEGSLDQRTLPSDGGPASPAGLRQFPESVAQTRPRSRRAVARAGS